MSLLASFAALLAVVVLSRSHASANLASQPSILPQTRTLSAAPAIYKALHAEARKSQALWSIPRAETLGPHAVQRLAEHAAQQHAARAAALAPQGTQKLSGMTKYDDTSGLLRLLSALPGMALKFYGGKDHSWADISGPWPDLRAKLGEPEATTFRSGTCAQPLTLCPRTFTLAHILHICESSAQFARAHARTRTRTHTSSLTHSLSR